ncbi:MAG: hypothetical protein U0S48_18040 [Solirubrobacteraceae bacterium]
MTSAAVAEVGAEQWTAAQLRVIKFIERWVELFGESPRAADLNPSAARNGRQEWRIERYRAGDPETGEPFLALNTVKEPFGGSLVAAIRAAGFEPARRGPRRRAEVRGREIDPGRLGLHPDVRVALDAARAEARDARAKLAVRDRQLAEARVRAARATAALRSAEGKLARRRDRPAASEATKVVRERVVDGTAVAQARARADAARDQAQAARVQAREANAAATRLAARLERAEATITTVRGEKAALRDELAERDALLARAEDRAGAAERQVAALRERLAALRARPTAADREAVELAERTAAAADRRAADAELRAVRAQRELRETVARLTGQARQLTAAEIARLRGPGPAGPSVFARAVAEVGRAHRRGDRAALKRALREAAAAAETWRGRL